MGKAIDETGNRHGRWTVLSRVGNSKKGVARWLCQCDCGTKRAVLGIHLRNGSSKSCGCLQRERAGKYNFIDRIGQRYGRLAVIEQQESTDKGRTRWLCQCDCGKEVIVTGHNLQSGNTKSCGCLWRDTVTLPEGEAALNWLINRMKSDANKRGHEWGLTREEVWAFTKQSCYYCGKEPEQVCGSIQYNGCYIYNGLDRLDSNKGYVCNNIVPCCKQCNYAKLAMSVSEFRDWIRRVYKHFAS